MTPHPLLLLVAAVAVYRGTRYLTADKVGEPIRKWAEARSPWLEYLSTCDWCVSTYLAVPASIVITWHVDRAGDARNGVELAVWFAVTWFAFSGFTGMAANVEQAVDARSRRDKAAAALDEDAMQAIIDSR